MFNEYTALKCAEYRRNDLLREAEHGRLVRKGFGAKNGKRTFSSISVVWQRRFWRKLFSIRDADETSRGPRADTAPLAMMTRRSVAVTIRRIAPSDAVALHAFVGQLSEMTLSLRYMTMRPLTAAAVEQEDSRMARGHTADHVTLIAIDHAAGDIIAVAELIRDVHQPTTGEFALVVRDDAQNDGLGSVLLQRLVQMSSPLGLARLRANLLADNWAMRALISKFDLPYTRTYQHGALEIVWHLTAPDSRSANEPAVASQARLIPHRRNS
jgi:GNAT superfamily N-acetyltransferase